MTWMPKEIIQFKNEITVFVLTRPSDELHVAFSNHAVGQKEYTLYKDDGQLNSYIEAYLSCDKNGFSKYEKTSGIQDLLEASYLAEMIAGILPRINKRDISYLDIYNIKYKQNEGNE